MDVETSWQIHPFSHSETPFSYCLFMLFCFFHLWQSQGCSLPSVLWSTPTFAYKKGKPGLLDWPDLQSTSQLQQNIGLQREREREWESAVGAVSSDKAVCSLVSTIIWAEACVLHDAACVCLYSMCCSMSDVCCVPQLHPWREEVSKFSASVFQCISMTGLIQSRKQCRQ